MDHKTQNFRFSTINKNAFYLVKTLNESKFEIIWFLGFKYAFIYLKKNFE